MKNFENLTHLKIPKKLMHIKLKLLSETFFNKFLDLVINDYSETLYANKSFNMLEDAQTHVETHLSFLLPNGLKTDNHTFFEITNITRNKLNHTTAHYVGYLWLEFSTTQENEKSAWINFIYIKPQDRHKGYAREALKILENKLTEKLVKTIGLTVFNTNKPAHELYLSLGYADTELDSTQQTMYWHMSKKLKS